MIKLYIGGCFVTTIPFHSSQRLLPQFKIGRDVSPRFGSRDSEQESVHSIRIKPSTALEPEKSPWKHQGQDNTYIQFKLREPNAYALYINL